MCRCACTEGAKTWLGCWRYLLFTNSVKQCVESTIDLAMVNILEVAAIGNLLNAAPGPQLPKPEILSCRVRGFYPFPEDSRTGLLGWLFKDTHQAISVQSGSSRLFMDFMTEGGATHPVWYNEAVKWHVLLGGSIRGEVRIRGSAPPGSKLAQLQLMAMAYEPSLNLYTSNCRIFCARMRREVDRLNGAPALPSDARLLAALLHAAALPMLYPVSVLLVCWEGLQDL